MKLGKDQREFKNAGKAALGPRQARKVRSLVRATSTSTRPATTFWQTWNNGDKERGLGLQKTAAEFGFGANTGRRARRSRRHASPIPSGRRRSRTRRGRPRRRSRRTASGTRPTTSSPQSVRAASPSRRCSSPTRTRRSPTAARCGSRTSKRRVNDPTRATPLSAVHAAGDPADQHRCERARRDARRVRRCDCRPEGHRVRRPSRASRSAPFRSRARRAPRRSACARTGRATPRCSPRYFPANAPQYVVVAVVEEGGHGRADRGADRAARHRGDQRSSPPASRSHALATGKD